MMLNYEGRKSVESIYKNLRGVNLSLAGGRQDSRSKLIRGDNMEVMGYLVNRADLRGKIDLVYIDPPFATSNVFRIGEGKSNSISRSNNGTIAYDDSIVGVEYLEFVRERLVLIKDLLSDKGSIYLHIDSKMGHYIKIMMDEVFGEDRFINEITRIKCNPKNFSRRAFGNIKDMILFYSKTERYIWNEQRFDLMKDDISRRFTKISKLGRRYTTIPVHAPGETINGKTGHPWRGIMPPKGRHWRSDPKVLDELDEAGLIEWSKTGVPRKKIYADESKGKKIQDIWEFKDPQYPEYPTEKNLDLLKLIVKTSSNEDSIVMDAFCGSGTTLKAAQELERDWIGIDRSDEAIRVSLNRLNMGKDASKQRGQIYEYLEQTSPEVPI